MNTGSRPRGTRSSTRPRRSGSSAPETIRHSPRTRRCRSSTGTPSPAPCRPAGASTPSGSQPTASRSAACPDALRGRSSTAPGTGWWRWRTTPDGYFRHPHRHRRINALSNDPPTGQSGGHSKSGLTRGGFRVRLFADLWSASPRRAAIVLTLIGFGAAGQATAAALAGPVLLYRTTVLFVLLAVSLAIGVVADLALGLLVA